jgi:hypothetical protein
MAKIKWRKWNRATHRDLGYFFFFMSLIYGISGIAINHIGDWNPNFIVTQKTIKLENPIGTDITKQEVIELLRAYDEDENFKNYYFPNPYTLKIFLNGGSALIDVETGNGSIERMRRRPIFKEFNYLHYNPVVWWTWFSDAYALGLVILAFTGLFIVRGKNGITRRGAWITAAGIIIPILFLLIYY